MAVTYRLRQFLRALTAHLTISERILIVQQLTDGELLLFERMSRHSQRHSLDVYHTLAQAGRTDSALLKAALLHDCGKVDDDGNPIPLLYYGIFVILKRLAPQQYEQAVRDGRGLLRPFAVHAAHDRRSALLAQAVGSPPEVVTILHDYAEGRRTPQTEALGWAD
ncbi:MAG: hypothetical protein HC828_17470, partial [Blastochloris sp.]|nr:hypothetical protein [Blastochloris sp.]